jgi:hypothetical protein
MMSLKDNLGAVAVLAAALMGVLLFLLWSDNGRLRAQATLKDAEISDLKREATGVKAAQVATDAHRDRVEFVIRDYREAPHAPTAVECLQDPALRAAMAYGDRMRAAQLNSAAAGPPAAAVHP